MATTIKLKNSVTTTNAPSSLAQGEVAINVTDKKVWVGNAATTPVQLLGTGADGSLSTLTVGAGTVSLPSITTTGDTNTGIFFPAADTIAFTEGGVESMRIDSSGNLGLGNAIAGAVTPSIRLGNSGSGGGVVTATLSLGSFGTGYGSNLISSSDFSSSSASYLALGTTPSGASGLSAPVERMRIDSSGNVGIGTSSPSQKLDIASRVAFNTSNSYGRINIARATDSALTALFIQGADNAGTGNELSLVNSGGGGAAINITGGDLRFYASSNTTERMRIDSSGNLLVGGTNGSGNRLFVRDTRTDTNRTAYIYNQGNTSGNQLLGLQLGTNTNNTSSYLLVGANDSSGDRIYIYGNGNIVNSNNSYGALSDQAIKENIVDASPKLDELMQVKIRNYNLIADESKTKQLGVVAQELEEVFPSMIEIDGISGHKQVKYSVFVPMLIKAIQEQQAIITDLKARIETLESK